MPREAGPKMVSTEYDPNRGLSSDASPEGGDAMSPRTVAVLEKIYPMNTELASVIESNAPMASGLRTFFSRVLMEQEMHDERHRDYANDSLRMSDVALLTHRFDISGFNPKALEDVPESKCAEAIALLESIMRIPPKDEELAKKEISKLNLLCEGSE